MTRLSGTLRRVLNQRRGISSVEYALLLAVIGGGIVIGAGQLTNAISSEMGEAADCIRGTDTTCVAE